MRRFLKRVRAYWNPVRVEAFWTLVLYGGVVLVYGFGFLCAAGLHDHLHVVHH